VNDQHNRCDHSHTNLLSNHKNYEKTTKKITTENDNPKYSKLAKHKILLELNFVRLNFVRPLFQTLNFVLVPHFSLDWSMFYLCFSTNLNFTTLGLQLIKIILSLHLRCYFLFTVKKSLNLFILPKKVRIQIGLDKHAAENSKRAHDT